MLDLVFIGWKFEVVDNYFYFVKVKLKKFWMYLIYLFFVVFLGFKFINFCGFFVMMDYFKKFMFLRIRML